MAEASPTNTDTALKARVESYYDTGSEGYLALTGTDHFHHGLYAADTVTSTSHATAAAALTAHLIAKTTSSHIHPGALVLDAGCGMGGTARHLAFAHGCVVTGISLSDAQVEAAERLTQATMNGQSVGGNAGPRGAMGRVSIGEMGGSVEFRVLDAEGISCEALGVEDRLDLVWAHESFAHFPRKEAFLRGAASVLKPGGRLMIADFFRAEDKRASEAEEVKQLEAGGVIPTLRSPEEVIKTAEGCGLKRVWKEDLTKDVKRTIETMLSVDTSKGREEWTEEQKKSGTAVVSSFKALGRGYERGTMVYSALCLEKV